jgi:hypothetical protein
MLLDSIRAEIDAKIRDLETEILVLKQRRNAVTPIYRLPSELLAAVFSILQHQTERNDPKSFFPNMNMEWRQVMLVCGRFRQVAIDTPTLWNVLDFSLRRTNQCVERAQDADLIIRMNTHKGSSHLKHACKAELSDAATHANILNVSLPHMRSLWVDKNHGQMFDITSSFLGGSPALLTQLVLSGVSLYFASAPHMPSLQRLKMEVIRTENFEAVRKLFENAPMLEELLLHDFISRRPTNPHEVIPVANCVSLPHLKMLLVSGEPTKVSALLRLLPLPSTALSISMAVSDDCFGISSNHEIAYTQYTAFGDSMPDTESSSKGQAITEKEFRDTTTLRFGTSFRSSTWDRNVRVRSLAIVLTLSSEHSDPHPIFDDIYCLRIHPQQDPPENAETAWHSHLFRNLNTLSLVSFRQSHHRHVAIFKKWVAMRAGRIERVEFERCEQAFVTKVTQEASGQTIAVEVS